MLDKTLDSKQKKTPNLPTNKNYLMIGQKVYKSESNNLIMFIAVSPVLGLSLPVLGFSILFKLFIFAMRKYIPSKS
ncbi:hypothetical protein J669_0374 [Acinetobacter baumannii 1295549]|nr:hypothetical protein J669_0374 [Acinetobacter baumannii 1295549]EXR90665.1 hypothetical protein J680_2433 [Acinetobacter baumannii 277047]EXS37935.1 hypothetical protein J677_2356 [Acinetobacter baumannii 426863]